MPIAPTLTECAYAAHAKGAMPALMSPPELHRFWPRLRALTFAVLCGLVPVALIPVIDLLGPDIGPQTVVTPPDLAALEAASAAKRRALVEELTAGVPPAAASDAADADAATTEAEDGRPGAPDTATTEADITAADTAAEDGPPAAEGDGSSGDTVPYNSAATADAADAALKRLVDAAQAEQVDQGAKTYAIYRAKLLLIGGLVLFVPLLAVMTLYQLRLVRRIWSPVLRTRYGPAHSIGTGHFLAWLLPFGLAGLGGGIIVRLRQVDLPAAETWLWLGTVLAVGGLALVLALAGAATRGGLRARLFANRPALVTGLTLACAIPLGSWAAAATHAPDLLGAALVPDIPDLAVLGVALVAGLFAALVTLTVLGTRTLSQSFPDPEMTEAFVHAGPIAPREAVDHAAGIWEALSQLDLPDPAPGAAPATYPTIPGPSAVTLVNAMVRVLAVTMVGALVVVSLALEVLVRADPTPAALADSLASGVSAWLLLLGVVFSVILGLVYIGPAVRLDIYASAHEMARKALDTADKAAKPDTPRQWSGRASGPFGDVDVTLREGPPPAAPAGGPAATARITARPATLHASTFLSPARPVPRPRPPAVPLAPVLPGLLAHPAPPPLDARLTRCLGADRLRFATLLATVHYGGAFHSLLEGRLQPRIRDIVTMIAPAGVSAVLALLK
ncbi:hypothetical protein P1J78_16650 [Psychromarinibacter sp. C21-152]|uniref:Uncharacterized protein n=1 Tax=Psychromarinibacter sediminicola TaxID=3033385 RepID=A0AAE3NWR5_9RHOB|nr:hypothetical protein [Psychromarinibacter sediminicola]MDF0602370.1 hypothetical protein [Psychromarinibacter sediminicola]